MADNASIEEFLEALGLEKESPELDEIVLGTKNQARVVLPQRPRRTEPSQKSAPEKPEEK